jgi:RimK family alpha-L-glutamate ligase
VALLLDARATVEMTTLRVTREKMINPTRICVLASPTSWHFLDLKRAAGEKFELESRSFEELSAIAGERDFGERHPIECFELIFARSMPAGSLQQVVFRMDVLLELERKGVRIVNPPRTIETAVDKYLALARLAANGVPVPRTAVSQTVHQALVQFERLGGDVVVKPLFGSMGKGLCRIQSEEEAIRVFETLVADDNVIYQQVFVDHGGFDLRLLVIGDQVLAMRRENSNHWITNIAQGGRGSMHRPTEIEKKLARQSARSVGAIIAGVDLLYDQQSGQPYVVEVNSAPAWQATSEVLKIDVAEMILTELQRLVVG